MSLYAQIIRSGPGLCRLSRACGPGRPREITASVISSPTFRNSPPACVCPASSSALEKPVGASPAGRRSSCGLVRNAARTG